MLEDCSFDEDRYVEIKGSLLDWQCKSCQKMIKDLDQTNIEVEVDLIEGKAIEVPTCNECGKTVRPNINFR